MYDIILSSEFNSAAQKLVNDILPNGNISQYAYSVLGCEVPRQNPKDVGDAIKQHISKAFREHISSNGLPLFGISQAGREERALIIAINVVANEATARARQEIVESVIRKYTQAIRFRTRVGSQGNTLNSREEVPTRTNNMLPSAEKMQFKR
jgi:ABC-type sugar transport system substrate-binding protein